MNPFLYYALAAIVTAFVWTLLTLRADQQHRQWLGLAGAWAAALVSLALWPVDNIPWLSDLIQPLFWVWLGAIVLLGMAAAAIWSEKPRPWAMVSSVIVCTVVNAAAVLHFLWLATVDAGGV